MHESPSAGERPLDFADFADFVGERFPAVSASGENVELTLTSATEREPAPHIAPGFALEFRIDSEDAARPQQMFTLTHPDVGIHTVFLVPVGLDEHGSVYQSVFSYLPD